MLFALKTQFSCVFSYFLGYSLLFFIFFIIFITYLVFFYVYCKHFLNFIYSSDVKLSLWLEKIIEEVDIDEELVNS